MPNSRTSQYAWALAALVASCAQPVGVSQSPGHTAASSTPLVDHHVHILSPDVMRDWKSLGVTFSRPDSLYTSPISLLAGIPAAVDFAVLVPMAHLYANPEFAGELGLDAGEARRRGRRENAHVARIAARHPGRAAALCSVPALAEWALEELTWCRDSLGVTGIKLHLASSQADLRERSHRNRIAAIVGFAAAHRLPILLHLDPQRRGHDSTHIRTFADEVLGPFPEVPVVIAHLGGSGGYGPWTRTVFRTLRNWLRASETSGTPRRVYFDISAVVLEQPSEGVPATTDTEVAMLREDLRAASLDRIIYGSDYPVFDPPRGRVALQQRVGFSAEEVALISRGPMPRLFAPMREGR